MDDIKRKLALIDKQLSGGFVDSYQRIISTSPLVFAAVGLILGILIQNTLLASQLFWLILLALCATGAFISFAIQRFSFNNHLSIISSSRATTRDNNQFIAACLALICFTCLGAVRLITFYSPGPDDIRNFVGNERKLATIRGLIVTDPYINRNENWKFARFKFTDPDASFYLTLGEIKTVDGWSKVSGTIRVQVAEPILDLKAGDYIQAYCWLDRFEPPTNPGQFDVARYLGEEKHLCRSVSQFTGCY